MLTKKKIIRLKNFSPLHIGTGKENYDFSASDLHSDTLSSALASIYAQQLNKNEDEVFEFLNKFSISSAFPYIGDMYFLPRINGEIKLKDNDDKLVKRLKQVKFIEKEFWERCISDKALFNDKIVMKNEFLSSDTEVVYKNVVTQRVSVSRDGIGNSEPYFFDWKFFSQNAGLYCFVDCDDEKTYKLILKLFDILSEVGIGTDKNVGGGKFEVDKDVNSIELTLPDTPNSILLLSLYIPKDENELKSLNLSRSRYDLLPRGGYIAGSLRYEHRHILKKTISMFSVGSCFNTIQMIEGVVVDLTPDKNMGIHKIYRSGKPFYLPIYINKV